MCVPIRESHLGQAILKTCHPEALFWPKDLPEYFVLKCRTVAFSRVVLALNLSMLILSSVLSASETSNFHIKDRSKASKGFEAVAHYRDLFWKNKRIAKGVEQVFISPSKRFALFRQNGGLFLADERRQEVCIISGGYIGIPQHVVWGEPNLKASLEYPDGHLPTTIDLANANLDCHRFQ